MKIRRRLPVRSVQILCWCHDAQSCNMLWNGKLRLKHSQFAFFKWLHRLIDFKASISANLTGKSSRISVHGSRLTKWNFLCHITVLPATRQRRQYTRFEWQHSYLVLTANYGCPQLGVERFVIVDPEGQLACECISCSNDIPLWTYTDRKRTCVNPGSVHHCVRFTSRKSKMLYTPRCFRSPKQLGRRRTR